jgi:PEP-CTERM motif
MMMTSNSLALHRRLRVCSAFLCGALVCATAAANPTVLWGGSLYEYVPTYTTWDAARAAAEQMTYLGFAGRLATVTSAGEQAAIASIVNPANLVMLGASDADEEGTWVWQTGPEAGTVFWRDGAPVAGQYNAWRPGEPNAFTPAEDYLVTYQGGWNDSQANTFLQGGYVVEYRLGREGFDFTMTDGHLGAVRNLAPEARLTRLDITLAGDTFFDSAATAPGLEFSDWSLVSADPGAGWTRPDGRASDGQHSWSVQLQLDPLQAIHFQVDLDRLSQPDGPGMAEGTVVTAHFQLGDLSYEVSGTVQAGSFEVLGASFTHGVRAFNAPVPEPATLWLFAGGLAALAAHARQRCSLQRAGLANRSCGAGGLRCRAGMAAARAVLQCLTQCLDRTRHLRLVQVGEAQHQRRTWAAIGHEIAHGPG